MKFLLALMLTILLPVQTGWAAIASLCADAGRVDAVHIGHHVHQSAATLDSALPDASSTAVAPDDNSNDARLDCPSCHGVGVAVRLEHPSPLLATGSGLGTQFVPPSQPQAPPGSLFRPPNFRAA